MALESATGKLNAYFDGRQPEIMGMIERLVNMDSFSEDGEDVNKVGETVSGWMREAGFHTEKIAKPAIDPDESWMKKLGSVFSARTHERAAGPGIVFLGHMGTVFPTGTAARPFRVEGPRLRPQRGRHKGRGGHQHVRRPCLEGARAHRRSHDTHVLALQGAFLIRIVVLARNAGFLRVEFVRHGHRFPHEVAGGALFREVLDNGRRVFAGTGR